MDEEVVIDLFNRAKTLGYGKTIDEFKVLLSTDNDVLNDNFEYVRGNGYAKTIDDFKVLIGSEEQTQVEPLKKKEPTQAVGASISESVSADGSSESIDFTDYTSVAGSPMMEDYQENVATGDVPQDVTVEDIVEVTSQPMARDESAYTEGLRDISLEEDMFQSERKRLMTKLEAAESGITYQERKNSRYNNNRSDSQLKRDRIVSQIKELEVANGRRKGILTPSEVVSLEEVLSGAKPQVELGPEFYNFALNADGTINKDNIAAAKFEYKERVKDLIRSQKKAAGYIEFLGDYYDPKDLPKGYGFGAAIDNINILNYVQEEEQGFRKEFTRKFGQYGFTFEEVGVGDNILITGPDGRKKEFPLDNWTEATDKDVSINLKRFMNNSYNAADISDEDIVAQAMERPSDPSKVGLGEEYTYADAYFNNGYDTRRRKMLKEDNEAVLSLVGNIEARQESVKVLKAELKDLGDKLNNDVLNQQLRAEYESKEAELNSTNKQIQNSAEFAIKAQVGMVGMKQEMERVAGARLLSKTGDWDFSQIGEIFFNQFADGMSSLTGGLINQGAETVGLINNAFYNEYEEGYWTDKERKDWKEKNSVPVSTAGRLLLPYLISGGNEDFLKNGSITYDADLGEWKAPAGYADEGTLQAFNEDGGIIVEGLTTFTRSLPAMLTGPARVLAFYGMGADHIDKLIRSNPELDDMPEWEKNALKIGIGVPVALLEEFGLRNILKNSSATSRLLTKVFKSFGARPAAQQTSRTFVETIKKVFGSKAATVAATGAVGMAAEYETEFFQDLVEVYGLEIYDAIKDVDYFQTSTNFQDIKGVADLGGRLMNKEVFDRAHHAGKVGAVGGFVMSMPGGISMAQREDRIPEIKDAAFDVFRSVTADPRFSETLANQTAFWNSKVGVEINKATGEVYTQQEVDQTIRDFEFAVGQSKSVRPEYAAEYQKKMLGFLMKRQNLENQIKPLDKATTREQRRQIDILNEDIAVLAQEAEQELAEATKKYDQEKKDGTFTGDFRAYRTFYSLKNGVEQEIRNQFGEQMQEEAVAETQQENVLTTDQQAQQAEGAVTQEQPTRVSPTTPIQVSEDVDADTRTEAEMIARRLEQDEVSPTTPVETVVEQEVQEEAAPVAEEEVTTEEGPIDELTGIPESETFSSLDEQVTEEAVPAVQKSFSEKFNNKLSEIENADGKLVALNNRTATRKRIVKRGVGRFASSETVYDVFIYPEGTSLEDITTLGKVRKQSIKSYTNYEQYKRALNRQLKKETSVFNDTNSDLDFRTKDEAKVQREKDFKEAVEDKTGNIDLDYISATGRLKEEEEEFIEKADNVFEVLDKMNELPSGNTSTNLDETTEGVSIDVAELNERTSRKLPTISSLKIIDGIPTIFTISDQLRTGDIVNPFTGNVIFNLRGGLGFTGTEGNENAAWANTTEKEAEDLYNKAVKAYEENQEVFEKWWKENPEFSGHIPMSVVKMGEGSMLSNEAAFRVLQDNLTKIPKKNKVKALKELKKSINDKIASRQATIKSGVSAKTGKPLTDTTIKNYKKEITGHRETLKTLNSVKPKSIDDVITNEFINTISLPARRVLLEQLTFGGPNRAGQTPKKMTAGSKAVPAALIEGMTKEAVELVHLGPITDLITEPQLKNVPQRNIIALQAVEIGTFNAETNKLKPLPLSEAVIETNHPNYPVGTKGKTIGILENPVSVVRAYPQAFSNAMKGLIAEDKKGKVMSKKTFDKLTKAEKETSAKPGELEEASVGTILTQAIGVQNGLPNAEFVGALAQANVSRAQGIMAFMNESFPTTVVSTDKESFDNIVSAETTQTKMLKGQVLYGVTKNGDIFINPDVHNTESELFNTSIHEFGHVWQDFLDTTPKGKKIYARGVELVKEEGNEYQKQLKKFKGNEAKAAKEAMAVLIGNKGETIAEAGIQSKFKEWLLGMWKYIQTTFKTSEKIKVSELQDITLDEFLGMALADIFQGKKVQNVKRNELIPKIGIPEAMFREEDSLNTIIVKTRRDGNSDEAIRIYAQSRGYNIKEINEALAVESDLFGQKFPVAFANVPGGFNAGVQLYNRNRKKINQWSRRNPNAPQVEIAAQASLILNRDQTFKTFNETLRKSLEPIFINSLQISISDELSADIKKMKQVVKERRRGAKELSALRVQLSMFIRKNMPQSMWKTPMVNKLLTKVAAAKYYKSFESLPVKPEDDIRLVMNDVIGIITEQRVNDSIKKINKQLGIKTTAIEGSRRKGKLLPEAQERIDAIRKELVLEPVAAEKITKLEIEIQRIGKKIGEETDDAKTEKLKEKEAEAQEKLDKLNVQSKEIEDKVIELRTEFNKLQSQNEITKEDQDRMYDIDVAIKYNDALLMENTNPAKAEEFGAVEELLKNMLTVERQAYNEVIKQAKERYNNIKSEFFKDVSGVDINFNDTKSVEEAKGKIAKKQNLKDNSNIMVKFIGKILKPFSIISNRVEDVAGLTSKISIGMGEMFGGKSAELIGEKFSESNFDYYQGKKEQFDILKENAERIFGKNYQKITENNQKRNTDIFIDVKKVAELKEKLKTTKRKKDVRKINQEIKSLTVRMSQNEMYYMYNQYKDIGNHPGIINKRGWGKNTGDIMAQINNNLKPEVVKWADWQVNEFFPAAYERYNEIYKTIYRTNMGSYKNYAGSIVREGSDQDADMMNMDSNSFSTQMGTNSMKIRIQNKKAILTLSGDNALQRYIDEMEYFRAYAENVRDITKMYNNEEVRAAIVATSSEDTYNVLKNQIDKVINRNKARLGSEHAVFSVTTSMFALSKLGFSPVIMLKQMTSALAFADYIGYKNWNRYAVKELKNGVGVWNKTWQEMYDASAQLQDRYNRNDFVEVLESYTPARADEVLGTSKFDKSYNKVMNFMMYLVKTGDKGGVMGSIPVYSYYKDQFKKKNPKATNEQVVNFAIRKTIPQIMSTQQSKDVANKDEFSTSSALMRTFSLFTSSARALLRKETYALRELYRKMYKLAVTGDLQAAKQEGKGSVKDNLRTFMSYHFAIPMLFQWVGLGLPGLAQDWDEDDTEQMGWAALLGNINSVFVLGDLVYSASQLAQGKPWGARLRNLPFFSQMESLGENYLKYQQSTKAETKAKYQQKMRTDVMELFGIPARNMSKGWSNLQKLSTGEYDDIGELVLRLLNYSDYQIEGQKETKKKKTKKKKKSSGDLGSL